MLVTHVTHARGGIFCFQRSLRMSNPSSRTADQLVTGLVDALTALLNANAAIAQAKGDAP